MFLLGFICGFIALFLIICVSILIKVYKMKGSLKGLNIKEMVKK